MNYKHIILTLIVSALIGLFLFLVVQDKENRELEKLLVAEKNIQQLEDKNEQYEKHILEYKNFSLRLDHVLQEYDTLIKEQCTYIDQKIFDSKYEMILSEYQKIYTDFTYLNSLLSN
jgi:uncharacterized membrane protein YraQ (UPF0718 family)